MQQFLVSLPHRRSTTISLEIEPLILFPLEFNEAIIELMTHRFQCL